MVLKSFHVKEDPQNDMNLATDPHLKIVPGTPQKQNMSYNVKKYIFSKICTHFHDFSKIAVLQAHSVIYKLAARHSVSLYRPIC